METQKLNPTIVYVLAIFGLLCCCVGGLGFILAGIAFIIAYIKMNEVKANPENYDQASVKSMNTAKIVALIVLIINILYLAKTIYTISTIGWDEIMEQSKNLMEQYQNK